MKSLKLQLYAFGFLLLCNSLLQPTVVRAQHRKFEKIQKYMDEATSDKLAGVVISIRSKKFGKWIGTSGYSNLEKKTPIEKETIFSLASIGKTYTAVAVLQLVEAGKIGLDDKIKNYLPKEIIDGFPNAEKVTVRHLLGHTSGLYNYNRNPELNELYLSGQLKLDTLSHMDALRRYAYGKTEYTKPLGTYRYSSTNYLLLTMIMDAVLPEGHEAYLRKNVLAKFGFINTYYKQTPPNNLVNHYGDINKDGVIENLSRETIETTNWYSGDDGIYAPIEEATAFLEKLVREKEMLNEKTYKQMTTWNDEKHPDYGLGLMADKGFPYKFLMGHSGRGIGITTDLYYFPEQDMTVAIFCNTGLRAASKEFGSAYYKMRNKIMKRLFLF
ncbi:MULTISPECIES: serine hydrolase [Flavobacteriaceae]|uniref:serine hydrolase domain-containing protein n=1 Tax=Flavobacteriaceae TaxID=49546 RepID=UPI001491F0CC|nr:MULTISPECIES: serine hydrolase domain-containing protein [Allomuricauda]MDC6366831.1 serine hydrolase [Muricauda sp. AC10]